MTDTPFKTPNNKDPLPFLPAGAEAQMVRDAVCPHCETSGSVHVSPFIMNRERHLHWRCSACRHVWVERDRRRVDRRSPAV